MYSHRCTNMNLLYFCIYSLRTRSNVSSESCVVEYLPVKYCFIFSVRPLLFLLAGSQKCHPVCKSSLQTNWIIHETWKFKIISSRRCN